ncbi:MAG: hypothetical protein KC414_14505, partial [Romboutsia sp.]|nr:hypothetical protein [Romboutsia sp.]
ERLFQFFTRFYIITLENLLGLIFDKDMKHNYDQQVELLYELISYLPQIPSLNGSSSNIPLVKEFIINIFSKNFKNVTSNALNLFVEGLFEIKNISLFKEHLNDFGIKIYEYGDDEDLQLEMEILHERIAQSNH